MSSAAALPEEPLRRSGSGSGPRPGPGSDADADLLWASCFFARSACRICLGHGTGWLGRTRNQVPDGGWDENETLIIRMAAQVDWLTAVRLKTQLRRASPCECENRRSIIASYHGGIQQFWEAAVT
ncbi:hypothetical protein C8034_v005608 [Colletotrichum sidae]|uniref:Uncharacterized protein n=1 Tax=Colletotrichum sidae TaxID=1347389 RepID=A0A4R8T636_9PEZI|nr:hypothetical protein C8034_v005608 [Colletotrichum sidae]